MPALSEKDIDDLRWALRTSVDFIALSFVRSAADVEDVRRIMREEGVMLPVIAKIEKPQAIDNLDEVVDAFDAFMVARGDLGVECPLEDVPFLQKRVIDKARRNAKPVIVATQMLESMIDNPRPTRAEASDVANAVFDGADAVMLSGETSVGEYPIETVETMARIIASTEDHELAKMAAIDWQPRTRGGVIAKAAAEVADRVGAKYLVAFTQSGDSARRAVPLPRPRPGPGLHPRGQGALQLSLTWGVETFLTQAVEHTDEMVRQVDEALLKIGRVEQGDLVVIIAGSPPGIAGSTNALRIHRMGDAINEVAPAYRGSLRTSDRSGRPAGRRTSSPRDTAMRVDAWTAPRDVEQRSSGPGAQVEDVVGVVHETPTAGSGTTRLAPATMRVAQLRVRLPSEWKSPRRKSPGLRSTIARCHSSSTIGRWCFRRDRAGGTGMANAASAGLHDDTPRSRDVEDRHTGPNPGSRSRSHRR